MVLQDIHKYVIIAHNCVHEQKNQRKKTRCIAN